ncbi:hypothetical protein [Brachybacterium sp. NPDC056505]|jgi:hypothetical protein|uniref:hypothetical protein n=1 Tax=Brachybacterium sp. NPDC056505 TaxID=3345843 RepID=UPI00366E67E4
MSTNDAASQGSPQNIHVHTTVESGSNRIFTILGTLLACGAVGMLAWAISAAGALDLAATGLSFFFMQLLSMMFKAGLIVIPEKGPGAEQSFKESRGILKTLWREFQEFQGRSPIWRMALLALVFTIGYLLFRWAMSAALGIFNNIWIAGAGAALVAALIISPQLFSGLFNKMKTSVKTKQDAGSGPEAAEGGESA